MESPEGGTFSQQPENTNPLFSERFIRAVIFDDVMSDEEKIQMMKDIVQLEGGGDEDKELMERIIAGILKNTRKGKREEP